MAGLGSIDFGGIGGAVSSVFGGIGTLQGAKAYTVASDYAKKASQYATENAGIAEASGRVQQLQANRQLLQVIGGQQADVASAGFAKSGSALDLLASSQSQGALTKALLGEQTAINVRGYQEEAQGKLAESAQYAAQASAAKTSGIGGIIGGVLKGVGAIFGLSDERLKTDISVEGVRDDGVWLYKFRYLGDRQFYLGVIAQQVQAVHPNMVMEDPDTGYLMVNYSALGVDLMPVGHA